MQPAAPSSSKPTSALQAGSSYGPMLRAVLESQSGSEDRSMLQSLIAASSCSSSSIRPTSSMPATAAPTTTSMGGNTIAPGPSTLMLCPIVTLKSKPPECAAAAASAASCGNSSLYLPLISPTLTLPSIHQIMQDQQHLLHDKLMLAGVLSGLPTPTIKPQPLTGLYEKPIIPNYLLQNYFLFSQNLC